MHNLLTTLLLLLLPFASPVFSLPLSNADVPSTITPSATTESTSNAALLMAAELKRKSSYRYPCNARCRKPQYNEAYCTSCDRLSGYA